MSKKPIKGICTMIAKSEGINCSREYVWQILTGKTTSNSPLAKLIIKKAKKLEAVLS